MADPTSQIKCRLPDGKVFETTVGSNDPVRVLHTILADHLKDNDFLISTPYPRKIFADADLDDITISKAGLSPKGMVIVQKGISFELKEAKGPLLLPEVIHIKGQAQFDKYIQLPGVLVVADFSAEWCPPCKAIAPVFEELAKKNGTKAVFLHIDVDQNKDLAQGKDVSGIPTFKFYKDGKIVAQFTGGDPGKLRSTVQSNL